MRLTNRLMKSVGIKLPPSVINDYSSPSALAAHIRARFDDRAQT
jgi:hypothetical protein